MKLRSLELQWPSVVTLRYKAKQQFSLRLLSLLTFSWDGLDPKQIRTTICNILEQDNDKKHLAAKNREPTEATQTGKTANGGKQTRWKNDDTHRARKLGRSWQFLLNVYENATVAATHYMVTDRYYKTRKLRLVHFWRLFYFIKRHKRTVQQGNRRT